MFLSIFFIIAFIICLLCVNHRNIITWSISIYCIGLIMLFAASVMYISSINLYAASNHLDYKLYYFFTTKHMSITEIARIIGGISVTEKQLAAAKEMLSRNNLS